MSRLASEPEGDSATISAWKTVQKGSSRSVEYQVSSPSRHSVRPHRLCPQYGFRRCRSAARPPRDGPPSGSRGLDALVPDLGHARRVKQVAEIHGSLELPVDKSVP
ncbi:hypothetical protein EVAR_40308_1 [Eumeta japonica]|uniref:Uncharacterized protein n=1 Tax=Eumeta variegata TaxID=151549 RepID=A0A4C1YEC7_EUMVA|nr:hypothetical protein EVAR_40308_1 [Eumeta japonica]